jgi:hypothetical protein
LEQLNGIYRVRGPRLTDDQRMGMTTVQVSCVETYERIAGVPFCRDDVPHLERALTLTGHTQVLRGIREASRFPESTPGFFIMKSGFAHVLRVIEGSKWLRTKARKSRVKVVAGNNDDVEQLHKDFIKKKAGTVGAPSSVGSAKPEVAK